MKITEIITGISDYIHISIYIAPNTEVYKGNASATDTIHSLIFSTIQTSRFLCLLDRASS